MTARNMKQLLANGSVWVARATPGIYLHHILVCVHIYIYTYMILLILLLLLLIIIIKNDNNSSY